MRFKLGQLLCDDASRDFSHKPSLVAIDQRYIEHFLRSSGVFSNDLSRFSTAVPKFLAELIDIFDVAKATKRESEISETRHRKALESNNTSLQLADRKRFFPGAFAKKEIEESPSYAILIQN